MLRTRLRQPFRHEIETNHGRPWEAERLKARDTVANAAADIENAARTRRRHIEIAENICECALTSLDKKPAARLEAINR